MLSSTKFQISSEDQESNRSRVLQDILSQSQFLDVTLVNDDREWGAHKLILSTVSPVLRRILDRGPQYHPLLYLRGAKSSNIEALLKFVYYGETSVQLADLNEFISLGNDLQLDGICEKGKEFENNENLKSQPIQTKEHSNDSHEGEFLEGVPEILANNCTLCDFTGMTAESLEKHMNLIHSRNKFQIQLENSNNDVPGRRKVKNSSPVWLCAVKLSYDVSECNICKAKITSQGGSTSNIIRHVSSMHSDDQNVIEMQRLFLEKQENERMEKKKEGTTDQNEDFKSNALQTNVHSNFSHKEEMLEPEQDKELVMPRPIPLLQYQAIMPPSNGNEQNEKDPLNETSYTMNTVSGKRKNCSPMWLCAVKLSTDLAQCKMCKVKISCKGGNGRQNLRNHMIKQHSDDNNVIEMKRLFMENNIRKRCTF